MSNSAVTAEGYQRAAALLQCEVASIKAIAAKESRGSGMLPSGKPVILFERHVFRRETGGQFDKADPSVSNAKPGGYGAAGEHQHARLSAAAALDRTAALRSASWGRFQIMGFNWQQCGHGSLQAFINAMYSGDAAHLEAFVRFILNDRRRYPVNGSMKGLTMAEALRRKAWAAFAYLYNGPNYAINNYDASLKQLYDKAPAGEKFVPRPLPG